MRPQEITPLYTYGEARAQGGGKTTRDGAEIDGELRGAEGREAGGGQQRKLPARRHRRNLFPLPWAPDPGLPLSVPLGRSQVSPLSP